MRYKAKPTLARPATPLAASVQRHQRTTKKLVVMATSLEGSKNNLKRIIYSRRSANSENMAKIGPVDFEIIGVTGIVKNTK